MMRRMKQPIPTKTFEDGETLIWGGITLITDERGVGEADSASVFLEPDKGWLFVGDIVENDMTPFLLEGHTAQWAGPTRGHAEGTTSHKI